MHNMVSLLLSVSRGKRRPRKRILLVDDDPTLLFVLQLLLQTEGYLTHTGGDASALEQLPSFRPDLILLNAWLTQADGRLLSRYLKNQEATRHIPIVLLVPHSKTVAALAKAGADDVLQKPFDLETLLSTIEKYV
jgi:CheY-like chemotaxis protein